MTRERCEDLLLGDIVGCFVVRESKGKKILSVKTAMEEVKHITIHQNHGQGLSLDKKLHFDHVEKLVDHYRENRLPGTDIELKS